MTFAPTRTSDSIWLATTPVDPDGKTGLPSAMLPALILRHLRESGQNASLEWVVDAELFQKIMKRLARRPVRRLGGNGPTATSA